QSPPAPSRHDDNPSGTSSDVPASAQSSVHAPVDTHHDAEEAALKRGATNAKGELDYALFLHAFRPATPSRDAQIQHLLNDVQAKSYVKSKPRDDFKATAYDGSDESLIPRIVLASMGEDQSVFQYPIPCDVLKARPDLLKATLPYYGSNLDNFLPQSGCGMQDQAGYPAREVRAFMTAATDADGHFIDNFGGSMVYGFIKQQSEAASALQIGPGALGTAPGVDSVDYPYQAWGYLSLNNYRTSLRIKAAYETAQHKLADYYGTMQTHHAEAMAAAKSGLYALVFGGNCGKRLPGDSTRLLLLQHAPLASIEHALSGDGNHDDLLAECEKYGGIDPLIMIAAGNDHEALDALLAHGEQVDSGNNIGKTPLMEASQFDQLQSVAWLLQHGANPNASTWANNAVGADGPLQHDARTPLMYAAANGSLTIIEMLMSAGADRYQTDSKGYRAIDYLLGYGPTSPNPVLTDEERIEAQTLLY
ncbi:MAG TPA: ankyrin repeat domain-containing protein, partial [Dyella sp.]|nr:ankyrin repeat domain-containing protein [Dyella sp.]